MPEDPDDRKTQEESIRNEILLERKFSLADAIGREGGSLIKGHSPIPLLDQVTAAINIFIRNNLEDSSMMLIAALQNTVKTDGVRLSSSIEKPLEYLRGLVRSHLDNPYLLYELAREADFRRCREYREKPFCQKPGEPPHPDNEYSHEAVRGKLAALLKKIEREMPPA
ncbi:MAG TPA: hypothetical protein P5346_15575 [Spirochaetota bacterium]|nr:hypothetical protein [Spirochaetota bacterium]HSA16159.1 hypothetical protein [Spirochaetota bacterium]